MTRIYTLVIAGCLVCGGVYPHLFNYWYDSTAGEALAGYKPKLFLTRFLYAIEKSTHGPAQRWRSTI